MKLWHDDIRKPPDSSWLWVRTNASAREILDTTYVSEASLDHDLGHHEADPNSPEAIFLRGEDEDTGYELVKWMVKDPKRRIPAKITIHSWNHAGARHMAEALAEYTWVIIKPYEVTGGNT